MLDTLILTPVYSEILAPGVHLDQSIQNTGE